MSSPPSSCSWHLLTYLLGWFLAALGIGLMVLSSDPVSTRGNWLLVLVSGIACTALGGALIVIGVAIPARDETWCRTPKIKNRNQMCEKHEGLYIRFPTSQLGTINGHERIYKAVLPAENIMTSPIVAKDLSYHNGFDDSMVSKNGGGSISNFGSTMTSWGSNRGISLLGNDSRCYNSEADESTAIMFYRETPV